MTRPAIRPSPAEAGHGDVSSQPPHDIGQLHGQIRMGVLGLVVAWMMVFAALNLLWSWHIVKHQVSHHMMDQARAIGSYLQHELAGGETLDLALETISRWPNRAHEIDIVEADGSVRASTGPSPAAVHPDGILVTVPLGLDRPGESLRLSMPRNELLGVYLQVGMLNLVAVVAAGLLLTLLMREALRRAARRYDALLAEFESLQIQRCRTERFEAMGRLSAGVAHEIRNPLNTLGLGLQRIRNELLPLVPEAGASWERNVSQLYAELRRVNGVVEEFLALARPIALSCAPVDLCELLGRMTELYAAEGARAGAELRFKSRCRPAPMLTDEHRLSQLLLNLIRNGFEAVQSTKKGGDVLLELQSSEGDYLVDVSDSACGLQEAETERLFELFYSTKRNGTGLGLPIARQIAEALGGKLTASRTAGRTVFRLRLPVSSPGSALGALPVPA